MKESKLQWIKLHFANPDMEADDSCVHWLKQAEIALNTFLISVGGLPQLFPLIADADNVAEVLSQIRISLEDA